VDATVSNMFISFTLAQKFKDGVQVVPKHISDIDGVTEKRGSHSAVHYRLDRSKCSVGYSPLTQCGQIGVIIWLIKAWKEAAEINLFRFN